MSIQVTGQSYRLVPWGAGISFPGEGSEVCPHAEDCFTGSLGEEGLPQLAFRAGRALERALGRGSAEGEGGFP